MTEINRFVAATVLTETPRVKIMVGLTYSSANPYEVTIVFNWGTDTEVPWRFSRDLLVDGMYRPAGIGDVCIYPVFDGIHLTIANDTDQARLHFNSGPVQDFLYDIYQMVPAGSEVMDIEAGLELLLNSGR